MTSFIQHQHQTQKSSVNNPVRQNWVASQLAPDENLLLAKSQILGNQSMQRLLQARAIQAKLAVNQPDDEDEKEADRTANRLFRIPEPTSKTMPLSLQSASETPAIQGSSVEEDKQIEKHQIWMDDVIPEMRAANEEVSQKSYELITISYHCENALETMILYSDRFPDEFARIFKAFTQVRSTIHAIQAFVTDGRSLTDEVIAVYNAAIAAAPEPFLEEEQEPASPNEPNSIGATPVSVVSPPSTPTSASPPQTSPAPPVTTPLKENPAAIVWKQLLVEPLSAANTLAAETTPDWKAVLDKCNEAMGGSITFEDSYPAERYRIALMLPQLNATMAALVAVTSQGRSIPAAVKSAFNTTVAVTPSKWPLIEL